MRARFLTMFLLVISVSWLALSYRPELIPWQVTLADRYGQALRWGWVISALVFVGVQGLLVQSSFTLARRGRVDDPGKVAGRVTVSRNREILWTAVPLVIMVVLFVASYSTLR